MTDRLSDRIAGAILLAFAVWYWIAAGGYAVSYGDPVGPAAFPRMLAVPLALFALFLVVRPDPEPVWIHRSAAAKQAITIGILLVYPLLIEPLGFPLSTAVGTAVMTRVLGATWLQAVIFSLALGVGLFVLFDTLLGLPLPLEPDLSM